MKPSGTSNKLKHLAVSTTQGLAGDLLRESQYVFLYRTKLPECAVSLTMPIRSQSYAGNVLPGVFRQNLPEGYLDLWIRHHFGKTMKMDDMAMLGITGASMIGRVTFSPPAIENHPVADGESLGEILAWKGTEDLFEYLANKYAATSGVSGIQPKVLLRNKDADSDVVEKSTIKAKSVIVKSSGEDYPDLAENEFLCMSIAKKAGMEVPDFWLSENRRLFVVNRFDLRDGEFLGFEDMTALMNRGADEKYSSSYENVAKAVSLFSSPQFRNHSLRELFRSVVLSILVRNGDAHLKNFGMLYTHPGSNDCRLSPLYDVVNTTCYIPKDTLALKLNTTKAWPARNDLALFGAKHCLVDRPGHIIEEIAAAAMDFMPDDPSSRIWAAMRPDIAQSCFALTGKGYVSGASLPEQASVSPPKVSG